MKFSRLLHVAVASATSAIQEAVSGDNWLVQYQDQRSPKADVCEVVFSGDNWSVIDYVSSEKCLACAKIESSIVAAFSAIEAPISVESTRVTSLLINDLRQGTLDAEAMLSQTPFPDISGGLARMLQVLNTKRGFSPIPAADITIAGLAVIRALLLRDLNVSETEVAMTDENRAFRESLAIRLFLKASPRMSESDPTVVPDNGSGSAAADSVVSFTGSLEVKWPTDRVMTYHIIAEAMDLLGESATLARFDEVMPVFAAEEISRKFFTEFDQWLEGARFDLLDILKQTHWECFRITMENLRFDVPDVNDEEVDPDKIEVVHNRDRRAFSFPELAENFDLHA
jgi:hypothetical protein